MKTLKLQLIIAVLLSLFAQGQQGALLSSSGSVSASVPNLIRFGGVLKDANGTVITTLSGVTFLIYKDEQGGAPLWMETQNVQPDKAGRYTVQLGAVSKNGLPPDVFMTGEARWLAVQIGTEAEQARVALVSVPYALKAGDAATLGGLPASAFVLAAPSTSTPAPSSGPSGSATSTTVPPPTSSAVTTTGGTVNTIPLFTTATNIQNSILTQTGTTAINVGGKLSLPSTGTATSSAGFISQPQDFAASVFNSGTAAPVAQTFQWQAEPVNNNKTTATGQLSLLYAAGTATPAETGLRINNKGQFTFAAGQTFPGAGTITGVTPGTDLTGGGTKGNVTLSLDTTKVPQLASANTFTANQTVNGNITATQLISNAAQGTAPLQVTSTTQVANLNASFVGGLSASAFQPVGSYATLGANTFTGAQVISGANLALDQTSGPGDGVVTIGGSPFLHTCCASNTTFVGSNAGSFSNTGVANTAVGTLALGVNTSGMANTAVGSQALPSNTTGFQNVAIGVGTLGANTSGGLNVAVGTGALNGNNTPNFNTAVGGFALNQNNTGANNVAVGYDAGVTSNGSNANTSGSNNTFLGYQSGPGTATQLTNATAIGANALVSASNALVLGGTGHGTANFTGPITFAAGQTFPGGTITGNESVNGNVSSTGQLISTVATGTAPLSVNSTTQVANLNASLLGGQPASNFATIGANNFSGNQMVNGNLSATGVVSGSGFQIGSNLFDFGSYANGNAFLGFAGNTTTTGVWNTASGYAALASNAAGFGNTASGYKALYSNIGDGHGLGEYNTGSGFQALTWNTAGSFNTAIGAGALRGNTSDYNTASGYGALGANSTGQYNTASGVNALGYNTTGSLNTASGSFSGIPADFTIVTGSNNTFVGYNSTLSTGTLNNATAIGSFAEVSAGNAMVLGSINGVNGCTSASNCASTFVGIGTTTPSYLLHIGNQGGVSYNNFLRVEGPASGSGNAISIGGHGDFAIDAPGTVAGRFVVKDNGIVAIGIPNPLVNPFQIKQGLGNAIADGWATYSSRRWKTNIHPLADALSKVELLRGVSYDMKGSGKHEIGVIAEEVGEVVPEVVQYEDNGKDARGVDYSRLTALLIEAVKQQQKQITVQQRQIAAQQSQLGKHQRLVTAQQHEIAGLRHKLGVLETRLVSSQEQKPTVVALK